MSVAADLRASFDNSFAAAREHARSDTVDLVGVVLGADPHAIRLDTIASVLVDLRITPVPARAPALIGVVGIRGAIVPVFDLGALLGYSPIEQPRWFVLVDGASSRVAFAFGAFRGQRKVAGQAFAARPSERTQEIVEVDSETWPVIDLRSIVTKLEKEQ